MSRSCRIGMVMVLATGFIAAGRAPAAFDPGARTVAGSTWRSYGVAVGDLDRDGDLDLVFATDLNGQESLVICANVGGRYDAAPARVLPGYSFNTDVAIGDIDGDGWLDLVAATKEGDPLLVWLSVEGAFPDTPQWRSPGTEETHAVALADFDGDGFLDLACANRNAPDAVYRGTAEGFADTPVWLSPDVRDSRAVAWGDLDGDGWLDLVVARADTTNVAWRGGPDGPTGVRLWESADLRYSVGVALGDLDGDGDLDVVCANRGQADAVYANEGGAVAPAPLDLGGTAFSTAAALGDVDNDGDLDIVIGVFRGNDRLHLNLGGALDTAGAAISSDAYETEDVRLADVDGDGFLDVVCANSGQTDVWYRNLAGPYTEFPVPLSPTAAATRAVLLADVTGDGHPDLLVGDDSPTAADSLYIWRDGGFAAGSAWGTAAAHRTYALAAGDVDGDGRNDLVCVHDDTSPALYLNGPAGLDPNPAWSAYGHGGYEARDAALADIDGDGDLDLLIANKAGPVTLHRNDGGVLTTAPAWSSPWPAADGEVSTYALALGDVDGDGDLDLVCANNVDGVNDARNRLFLNNGSGFSAGQEPDWIAGSPDNSRSVVLGDLDGDGYVDLVFGNGSSTAQANTIYFNRDGTFPAAYDWDDAAPDHTETVTLLDADADGDLDLFCGNWQEPSHLYENVAGTILPDPRWTLAGNLQTGSAAAGDVDDDGDIDLLVGISQGTNLLVAGGAHTEAATGAGSPAGPDQAPYVSGVTVTPAGVNTYRVDLRVHDREGDDAWIVPEFQFAGDPRWYTAETGADAAVGPLATTAAGVDHVFLWDVGRAPIDRRAAVLRVRTVSVPRGVSAIGRAPAHLERVGPLAVARPEIAVEPGTLVFPTVSLGDTVTVALFLRNTGTTDLDVTGFDLASDELGVTPASAPALAPGAAVELAVRLAPRTGSDVGAELGVLSSDPLTPRARVGITTDIRSLDFTSRLLTSADTIPLGDAVTVIATPAPQVRVEDGYLFHRAAGAASFTDSIRMARSEGDFIAVVPGWAVTESGLEYYLRLENSGVFATDPPGAPGAAVHARTVASPAGVTALARFTAGDGYASGQPVRVDIALPDGAEFVAGSLRYRIGGDREWSQAALAVDASGPYAVIPDSMVGVCGVEYWAEVGTLTAVLTDPPAAPELTPRFLPVSAGNLVEPGFVAARAYRMVSVPLLFADDAGTIEGLLYDQSGYGSYDPVRWRCFRYDPARGRYLELGESAEAFRPVPGRAFWLASRVAEPLDTAPAAGLSPSTLQPWTITLEPGWNQVGHPFGFPVAWAEVTIDGLPAPAAQEALVVEAPVAWDSENQLYFYGVERLVPFGGYWVRNLTGQAITMAVPARRAATKTGQRTPAPTWSLALGAASGGVEDGGVIAGVGAGASAQRDRFDVAQPPADPGWLLLVHFPRAAWSIGPGRYAVDMRPDPATAADPADAGETWPFDVAKNWQNNGLADEVTVTCTGLDGLPEDYAARLVDRVAGRTQDLRTDPVYTYNLGQCPPVAGADDARFLLVVGLPEYVAAQADKAPPARTALLPNRPNPFNPATMVRYALSASTEIKIVIYDARGRRVRTLVDASRPAGRHEALWDGRDDSGRLVAAGVYVGRMTTGDGQRSMQKMTLIR